MPAVYRNPYGPALIFLMLGFMIYRFGTRQETDTQACKVTLLASTMPSSIKKANPTPQPPMRKAATQKTGPTESAIKRLTRPIAFTALQIPMPKAETGPEGQPLLRFSFPTADHGMQTALMDRFKSYSADDSSFQWRGKIEGQPLSSVVLTQWKNRVFASIQTGSAGEYELRGDAAGMLDLVRLDEHSYLSCADGDGLSGGDEPFDEESLLPPLATAVAVGITNTVDVVIGYNEQARIVLGGDATNTTDNADIIAKILTAVGDANTAYEDSDINLRMRAAWIGSINYPYPASENFNRALDELHDFSDGNADELSDKRAEYQADFTCLWLESSTSGGLAAVLTTSFFSHRANSIVRAQNSTSTFVHEIGHNMGCRHHRESYTGTPSSWTPYAFANTFTSTTGITYVTVMSSSSYAGSITAIRLKRFSNPNVSYLGGVTGIADDRDTARNINENRATYEAFQDTPDLRGDIASSNSNLYVVNIQKGFVGEVYLLERRADLGDTNVTDVATVTTDLTGYASATNATPANWDRAYYQWRKQN